MRPQRQRSPPSYRHAPGRTPQTCPVEDGAHPMHHHRDIGLNPLRAAMVTDPADDPCSSHRQESPLWPPVVLILFFQGTR